MRCKSGSVQLDEEFLDNLYISTEHGQCSNCLHESAHNLLRRWQGFALLKYVKETSCCCLWIWSPGEGQQLDSLQLAGHICFILLRGWQRHEPGAGELGEQLFSFQKWNLLFLAVFKRRPQKRADMQSWLPCGYSAETRPLLWRFSLDLLLVDLGMGKGKRMGRIQTSLRDLKVRC